jgi:hypothetical protein
MLVFVFFVFILWILLLCSRPHLRNCNLKYHFFFFFFCGPYSPWWTLTSFTIARHWSRSCDPATNVKCFSTIKAFYSMELRWSYQPHAQPQNWGTSVYLLSGSSPLSCQAWEILQVATLPPAKLWGSHDHANPKPGIPVKLSLCLAI